MIMLTTGPALTQSNARAALKMGLVHIATGADRVDCAPLAHFDSAALAVLLAWRRATRARGMTLRLLNVPAQLANLARAYGIDTLIADRKTLPFKFFTWRHARNRNCLRSKTLSKIASAE